jgi:hypothetical protein
MGFGFYWEYTGSKYLTRNYCSLHESSATVCRPLDQYIKHSFTNVLVVYLSRSGISLLWSLLPAKSCSRKSLLCHLRICMVKLLPSDFVLRFSTLFGDTINSLYSNLYYECERLDFEHIAWCFASNSESAGPFSNYPTKISYKKIVVFKPCC